MKKNLLTLGILATSLSVQAQILLHVDNTATMYVSDGTLVYNGGGLQTRGSGIIDLHGNMMVVGSATPGNDVLKTINADAGSTDKLSGSNIIIRLNGAPAATAKYGQLYITGISQGNLTAIVDKEYANTKHGAYQQIAIPFFNKTFASLSTELGTLANPNAFDQTRWGGKEILKWDNDKMRFDGSVIPSVPITAMSNGLAMAFIDTPSLATSSSTSSTSEDRTAYYILGTSGTGYDASIMKTVKGRPYSDAVATSRTLQPGTPSVVFGVGGNNRNFYQEAYNSYIDDPFNGLGFYAASFARNLYKVSNPFLTNLDLTFIGYLENGGTTDENSISNILGIAVDPQNVTWNSNTGGASQFAETQKVTFNAAGKPTGNFDALIIKPFNTFKIKLRDNATQTLNFNNLRRFAYTPRAADTAQNPNPYSVTAQKNTTTNNGTKQLGVIALDANGNQIGETYMLYHLSLQQVTLVTLA